MEAKPTFSLWLIGRCDGQMPFFSLQPPLLPALSLNSRPSQGLTMDRRTQFTSVVGSTLCARMGIQHHRTTIYHSQKNGVVEKFHRKVGLSPGQTDKGRLGNLPTVAPFGPLLPPRIIAGSPPPNSSREVCLPYPGRFLPRQIPAWRSL
jgi:transposase InsO family protein